MRIDLHCRRNLRAPREHVAELQAFNHCSIVGLSRILLDMGDSPFTQMISGRWVTLERKLAPGAYFQHEGQWVKAYKVRPLEQDDWFAAPQWSVQISEPLMGGVTHHWLEDELMPRVLTSKFVPPGLIITNVT